jgi:hypothetical protein
VACAAFSRGARYSDQFQRLLAGEDEATVFPDPEAAPQTPAPAEEPKRERQPVRPAPLPASRRHNAAPAGPGKELAPLRSAALPFTGRGRTEARRF